MTRQRKHAPSSAAARPNVLRPPTLDAMACLVQAQRLLSEGELAPAEKLLCVALKDQRSRVEANYLLAIARLQAQLPRDGLAHAMKAVEQGPGDPRFHFALGRARKACGDLEGAEAAYRRALELEPAFAEVMVSLGIVLKVRSDIEGAIALYERAIAAKPNLAAAHANLAIALSLRVEQRIKDGFDQEVDTTVLDAQGRAVALDEKNPQLHRHYGILLSSARRYHEAIAAFNEALSLDASDIESCLRLGGHLSGIGDSRLARQTYEKWLERNPPQAPVMRALAWLLTRNGEVDLALSWSEKALALDRDANALLTFGSTLMQSRRLEESLGYCREGVDLSGRLPDAYPTLLLGLNYLHEDPQVIADAHAEFGRCLALAPTRPPWHPRPQRLRVGYVSGDLVRHSVTFFLTGLLEQHDKQRFEVVCYHNNQRSDGVTQHLKTLADQWVECDGLSDEALRRRVIADGIDVLVDLSGHTASSRVLLFAKAAAPLQIAFLGYPTVSGVPSMDFRITDRQIDPGDQPVLPHDRPLTLDRSMFCYRPDVHTPLAEPPALGRRWITFGSFNNIAKITDHTLELWAAAMNAVAGSRLLLKAAAMAQASNRASIEGFMAARGVDASRLDLVAWLPDKSGHLGLYNEIDIALDTFPYNGATTTCEALWMGVPVVSRRGATHTSRMGASVLSAIGRGDWVADSDAAFVQVAARLAADPAALAAWRAGARTHLQSSPLFDAPGFARAFEQALDTAWDTCPAAQSARAAARHASDALPELA
jgi:protein O-GlcNAc transferase